MKKRTLALIVMFALVLTSVFALVACDKVVKHKVAFYDGKEKINEVEIEDGKTIDANYKPEKTGMTFVGWYDEVSLSGDPFDVTTPIKADTKLYGKWQSNTVETDTRIWYVMGNTVNAGWDCPTVLNDDGEWEVVESLSDAILTQKEGTNEFSIELEMRAGKASKFRFATQLEDKSTWAGENRAQAGLGNIVGFEFADGVNPNGGDAETADSHKYGNVKKDSAIIFEGGREFDDSPLMWNIFVTADSEGIYKFTLTTYPGEDDRDVITWEKVGDVAVLEKTFVPYIAGSMTGWGDTTVMMTEVDVNNKGEGTWRYVFNLEEAGSFKVLNKASGAEWLGKNDDDPGKLVDGSDIPVAAGTSVLIVNSVDRTYKLEKAVVRVVGTIDGNAWGDGALQRAEGYKDNMYAMNKVDSAAGVEKYELVLEITADHGASWLGAGKVAAIKTELCGAGYDVWGYGIGNDADGKVKATDTNYTGNIELDEIGWYKVTLEISYNADNERQAKVSVEKTTAPVVDNTVATIFTSVTDVGLTTVKYDTLEAALAAVKANETIVLQKDVKVDTTIVITKKITLDLNGKTITSDNNIWGTAQAGADPAQNNWSIISVQAGGDLTITGNGKVIAKAGNLTDNVSAYAVDVRAAGAKLTIVNGEFVGNRTCIYVRLGSATINGGKYSIYADSTNATMGHKFVLNLKDDADATLVVNGGSFVNYDPSASASEASVANFLGTGCTVASVKDGDDTVYTVAAPAHIVVAYTGDTTDNFPTKTDADLTYTSLDGVAVAQKPEWIGITSAKNSASTDLGLNATGNQIRLYCNKNNATGTSMTIALTGKTITKIVVVCTSNKEDAGKIKIGETEVDVRSTPTKTISVDVNAASVVLQNVSNGTAATQIWIDSIIIYYADAAAAE